MENVKITNINDITRDFLETYINDLPREEKRKLRSYLEAHPSKNASGTFTTVRSYIFNTYFRPASTPEKKRQTFADTLNQMLDF